MIRDTLFNQQNDGAESIPRQKVRYSLEYLTQLAESGTSAVPDSSGSQSCKVDIWHDVSGKRWQMTVQLEPERYWFLSVSFRENGTFDTFSLDYEDANDSHYEFREEQKIRRALYKAGDEELYLHEVLSRFIRENGGGRSGGFVLLKQIPVTSSFHFY